MTICDFHPAFPAQINQNSIAWPLGYMLALSNMIPAEAKLVQLPMATSVFAGLLFMFSTLAILCFMFLAVALVQACYWMATRGQHISLASWKSRCHEPASRTILDEFKERLVTLRLMAQVCLLVWFIRCAMAKEYIKQQVGGKSGIRNIIIVTPAYVLITVSVSDRHDRRLREILFPDCTVKSLTHRVLQFGPGFLHEMHWWGR